MHKATRALEQPLPDPPCSPAPSAAKHSPPAPGPYIKKFTHEDPLYVLMQHLRAWAEDHDSSLHFHGEIAVLATGNDSDTIQLGKPVKCTLTHAHSQRAQRQIVVRLFPPRKEDARYAMVVRCASGWMAARDFFTKEYFLQLQVERKARDFKGAWDKDKKPGAPYARTAAGREATGAARKQEVRATSASQVHQQSGNSVKISPVFHRFLNLPQEIQDMIWVTAAGLTGIYRPCRHRTTDIPVLNPSPKSPITPSTMLRVCKSLYAHMAPWIYRTTRFHFELTGFTNFLWISGPENRKNLRRVTFKFSSLAPLHCLRWLSPDPVFMLFDPPAYTSPHGLQYFWRCQIQDLARELHLHTLTLDLQGVQPNHVQMVVRILQHAFGSVQHIRFQEDGKDIEECHWRLEGLKVSKTWRELCRQWYTAYSPNQGYMSDSRRAKSIAELEGDMDAETGFFDGANDRGARMP